MGRSWVMVVVGVLVGVARVAGAADAPKAGGAAPKALAKPQPMVAGQTVLYQLGAWKKATVTGRDGARVKVKPEDGGPERTLAEKDLLPYAQGDEAFFAAVAVGDWVLFDDTGGFTKMIVVARDGVRVKLHKPSLSADWDKWVEVERTRPLLAGIPADGKAVAARAVAAATQVEEKAKGQRAEKTATEAKTAADATAETAAVRAEWEGAAVADVSQAREVKPDAKATWTMQADGGGFDGELAALPGPVQVGMANEDRSIRMTPRLMPLNVQPAAAAVILNEENPFDRAAARDRVVRVELAGSGRVSEPVVLPRRAVAFSVSADGKLLLAKGTVPDVGRYLTIYAMGGGSQPQAVARWRTTGDKGITWGAFAGAGHAVTLDEAGVVTGWELPPAAGATAGGERLPGAKAVYRIDLGMRMGATPVLSPGGRYMAAVVGGRAMFFDTATGGTVGVVEGINWPHGNVSFRPDGKQVSVSDVQRINVLDAASGKVERTVPIPQDFAPPMQSVRWLSKTHVLMGETYLVDLERRRVIWRYELPTHARALPTFGGVSYFFKEEFPGRQVRLFSVKLLEHASLAAPPGERPIEELMVFAAGTKVAVVLATDAPVEVRGRIQKSLEEQVRAMGLVVDPAAPLRVTARSETGRRCSRRTAGSDSRSSASR